MARLKRKLGGGRRLVAALALLSALVLVAAGCGGGGGGPDVGPGGPEIPIVPADDHGDTRADATALALGGSVQGQIEEGDDDDFFRVRVTEAGTLTVYTTGSLDTVGELQANDGSLLTSDDDSGGENNYNFRIEHDVGPGTYYVKVNSHGTATGSYVVLASFLTRDTWGAIGAIPPQTMARLDAVTILNLEQFFSYTRTTGLHFTATAADPDFVLILFPVAHGISIHSRSALGSTTVTVTATDSSGRTASQTFSVTVENLAPRPGTGLYQFPESVGLNSNHNAPRVGGEHQFDLDTYFYDPDGDELSYKVTSSNSGAVSAQIIGRNKLVLTGVHTARDAHITVTATDTYGASVAQNSLAIVRNDPPTFRNDWSPEPFVVTVEVCETLTLDLSGYFVDRDGDEIAYGYPPDHIRSYPQELLGRGTHSSRHIATANISEAALKVTGVAPGYTTHDIHAYNPHAYTDERYYRDISYGDHDSWPSTLDVEIEVTGEERECDSDQGGEPPPGGGGEPPPGGGGEPPPGGGGEPPPDGGGEPPPDGGGDAWYAGAFNFLVSGPMIVSVNRPTAEANEIAVKQQCRTQYGEDEVYCIIVAYISEGTCVAQAVADERFGEGVEYFSPISAEFPIGEENPRAAEETALQQCRSRSADAESCRIAVSGVCAVRP